MTHQYLQVNQSGPLSGSVDLFGAKNGALVIMTSLLLTEGVSTLYNVPNSTDVQLMIKLLESLGALITFSVETHVMKVDTRSLHSETICPSVMNKMRASILAMGPLLARFGKAIVANPGGCLIGARPIDYHLKGFKTLGVAIEETTHSIIGTMSVNSNLNNRIIFEYPSVGATENILMAATLLPGQTTIINAALEPEVLDLILVLKKMGAQIETSAPATIIITGVSQLYSIEYEILPDRLEAGALLLAAAMTKGSITLNNARPYDMDIFLLKLQEMGHTIITTPGKQGITFHSTEDPQAVSFKTGPYPGFPTDLQAPMMAVQAMARGSCVVEETVFENRLMHVRELQKMGAHITMINNQTAQIKGVDTLYGAEVIAPDIRASCALVLAGLAAEGKTKIIGLHQWQRAYDGLEKKLIFLGANLEIIQEG